MTFQEFKDFLKSNKTGNINLPKIDEEYKPLLQASLEYVANNVTPIDLSTDDVTAETLRWINGTQLVKRPSATVEDISRIDIDEQLTYAVAYHFLMMKTSDATEKSIFRIDRDDIMNTYTWNNFNFLQELGAVK